MRRVRKICPGDESGQSLMIVALFFMLFMALVGIAIDIAWFQYNVDKMQRAADAGALAGVVYLPGNVSGGQTAAMNAVKRNGYQNGVAGTTVTVVQEPLNDKMFNVTITAPVKSFFARMFGIPVFTGTRNARAEFVLPVPMGSPQDYLGIYQLCQTSGTCLAVHSAPTPLSGPVLTSQGFWGGVITKGGQRSNGDAYSPAYDGGTNPNATYDPNGYSYTVEFPTGTSSGEVWLFDPAFCATGHGTGTSYLGTGDHWIGTGGQPVTTEYRLWDMNGTPYTISDDTLLGTRSYSAQNQVDKSANYRGDQAYSDGGYNGSGSSDCQSDAAHNNWVQMPGGGLSQGQYRLQVTTSSSGNDSTSAENMFGIQVKSNIATGARVYGQGRMAAYANVNAGASLFYLAQIPAIHAGKTLEIKLFDPGDVGGNATLRIKKPTSTGYVNATFSYTATGGVGSQSGSNVTSLTTASSGTSQYQNAWVTITIALPTNYGSGGLTPPGETEAGWWKIEYTITSAGNDTTTWETNIRGNPVHLVVP
jgi:hypothetical protein